MTRLVIGLDASFTMTVDEDYTLRYLVQSDKIGFDSLWLGDHFLPWHHSFKHCFFVWSMLPAIAARTKKSKSALTLRYLSAAGIIPIIAQASATMDRMFPGRFQLGVGTGEAMNEALFMSTWPRWEERGERLIEALDLIKKLWTVEDYFSYNGKYFKMENVHLHLKPKTQIPVYFSAFGENSAYAAGKCSTRLMTGGTVERCRDVIFPKFEEGIRSAGKDVAQTEKVVLIDGGIGPAPEIVKKIKRYSAGSSIMSMFNERDPRRIEQAGNSLPDEQILRLLHPQ